MRRVLVCVSVSLVAVSYVKTQHTVCALCSGPLALQCLDVGVAVGHVLLVLALGRRLLLTSLLQVALQILIRNKTRRVETHLIYVNNASSLLRTQVPFLSC